MILLIWKRLKETWDFKPKYMDFYKNSKRLNIFRIIVLVGFLILLGVNLFSVFVNKSTNYWGITANLLMAVSMIIQIRRSKKEKNIDAI